MTDGHKERIVFIRAHATVESPPFTSELKLWLAKETTELWEATEEFLAEKGLPPPFWAFAWAGGQALARFALDQPETVRGKRVLDFGAGCGMVAIAALMAKAPEPPRTATFLIGLSSRAEWRIPLAFIVFFTKFRKS